MDEGHSPAVSLNDSLPERHTSIKIIGVGGAGSNGVDRLKMENLGQVPLVAINTDAQALASSPVEEKCMIGKAVTRGLGTGGDPELGRVAAEADLDAIHRVVAGVDLVFLLAGMGGGTGSGAAPVVAKAASDAGALVIAFVTLPFTFEGPRRQKQAEEGLALLRKNCDAVIPLPNDILLQTLDESASVLDAFEKADEWVARGVKSIWSILSRTGLINLDFATLKQVFCNKGGKTLFGLGCGEGPEWVQKALQDLMLCPLLHTPEFSRKADRLLVNIVGGPDLAIAHVNEIMGVVNEHFGKEAHVVLGAVIDEGLTGRLEICVLGTTDVSSRPGLFNRKQPPASRPAQAEPSPAAAGRVIPQPSRAPGTIAAPVAAPTAPIPAAPAPVTTNSSRPAAAPNGKKTGLQEEFLFAEAEKRGYFDRTDDNVFQGEDLDIPTYLRRGVRIQLH
jgi:cell division protein FtsZ